MEFKKASSAIIKEMWSNFYDEEWPETPFKMPDSLWTPAEVSAILFNNFGEPMAAIEYLAKK